MLKNCKLKFKKNKKTLLMLKIGMIGRRILLKDKNNKHVNLITSNLKCNFKNVIIWRKWMIQLLLIAIKRKYRPNKIGILRINSLLTENKCKIAIRKCSINRWKLETNSRCMVTCLVLRKHLTNMISRLIKIMILDNIPLSLVSNTPSMPLLLTQIRSIIEPPSQWTVPDLWRRILILKLGETRNMLSCTKWDIMT